MPEGLGESIVTAEILPHELERFIVPHAASERKPIPHTRAGLVSWHRLRYKVGPEWILDEDEVPRWVGGGSLLHWRTLFQCAVQGDANAVEASLVKMTREGRVILRERTCLDGLPQNVRRWL